VKIGAIFNLPLRLVDERKYELCYEKAFVKVDLKLVQNHEAAEKIMGMNIETSGEGSKVDLTADDQGIVNFTHIKMEIDDNSTS
jgi:hypothetical protein